MQATCSRGGALGALLAPWLLSSAALAAEPPPAHRADAGRNGLTAEVPRPVSPARDREEARRLYLEGSRHVESGEWALARSDYQRSFALYASPSTLVNLALCETELGHLAEAARLLERALTLSASIGPRFDRERQAAVEAERDRLHRAIELSRVEASDPAPEPFVTSPPPRAETPIPPASRPLRTLGAPTPTAAAANPPPGAARPYRVLGVGGLIAGGVAFTTALVSAGVLLDADAALDEKCSATGVCPTELTGTVRRYETAAVVTNAGVISGVTACALGLVFLTLDGRSPKASLALQASPSNVRLRMRF